MRARQGPEGHKGDTRMREDRYTWEVVARHLIQGVEEGWFPGAVLLVGSEGHIAFEEAAGNAALTPAARTMTLNTVFDLASLTKPIATTTALMLLIEAGELALDRPVSAYLSSSGQHADETSPTLRHLLTHCGGLPAWRPYYRQIDTSLPQEDRKKQVHEAVHREPRTAPPGTAPLYSDAGFILLGEIVETVTGTPLDEFCAQAIFRPLGLTGMGFINLGRPRPGGVQFASTEACSWRQRVLDGEVHDENAWIMGGVAGHAGLFAAAHEVWRFAQGILDGLHGKPWLVSTGTLRAFTQRQSMPIGSSWALGWDTPTPEQSSSGRYFSPTAIGHLGFTGTSLWIDPVKNVSVVLLTNRVHPSRQREGIKIFRPTIHDAVMQALKQT